MLTKDHATVGLHAKLRAKTDVLHAEKAAAIPGPFFTPDGHINGYWDAVEAIQRAQIPVTVDKMVPAKTHLVGWSAYKEYIKATREYQRTGIQLAYDLCVNTGAALIADDMGLGKTRESVLTAFFLDKDNVWVIVCPASVRRQWREELKLVGRNDALVIDASVKAEKITDETKTIITSYELAGAVSQQFEVAPGVVIIDELDNLMGREKNYGTRKGTQRSKEVRELAIQAKYRIGLTGTPEPSRPRDLWQQLHILWPWRFGKAYDFDVRYCNGHNNGFGFENKGSTNPDELKRRLSYYMIRRVKAEVAKEMPKVTRLFRYVPAYGGATNLFRKFEAQEKKKVLDLQSALLAAADHKITEVLDVCSKLPNFLLLTYRKDHAKHFGEKLSKTHDVHVLTGDLSEVARRKTIVSAAKNGSSIVATIDSIGVGMDGLQHVTSNGVMHHMDWRPRLIRQAEARLDRLGQKLPVTWTYILMRESADIWVVNNVVRKLDVLQATMPGVAHDGTSQLRMELHQAINAGEDELLDAFYNETKGKESDDGGE